MAKKERVIIVKIPEDVYFMLKEKSKVEGYSLVTDYVKALINRELGLEKYTSRIDKIEKRIKELEDRLNSIPNLDRIEQKILRTVQDMVNPFTAKINELSLKFAEIVDRLDDIESKVKELEQRIHQISVRTSAKRKTGLERLKEQGVLFESELRGLRDRDSFFAYLEHGGAKVIATASERIAVDRDFWERFKRKLFEEITTNNEDQIRLLFSKVEYKLFTKLKESGLIYYDSSERRWKPISREIE